MATALVEVIHDVRVSANIVRYTEIRVRFDKDKALSEPTEAVTASEFAIDQQSLRPEILKSERQVGDIITESFVSGQKVTLTKISSFPYAAISTQAVVCTLNNLQASTVKDTQDGNGQISLSVSGGFGNKRYSINAGGTYQLSPIFTGLRAGTYNVQVIDEAGCTITERVTVEKEFINNRDSISGSYRVVHEQNQDGNDGRVLFTATSDNQPLRYTLFILNGQSLVNNNGEFNNLPPGVYGGLVTDSQGNRRSYNNIYINPFNSDQPNQPLTPTNVLNPIKVHIQRSCGKNPFVVLWKNRLGGWSHWVFPDYREESVSTNLSEQYYPSYTTLVGKSSMHQYAKKQSIKTVTLYAENTPTAIAKGLAGLASSHFIMRYEKDEIDGKFKPTARLFPQGDATINPYLQLQNLQFTLRYSEQLP